MLKQIRKKIDAQIKDYLETEDLCLKLLKMQPSLHKELNKFAQNGGKRIRPLLFVLAYEALAKKKTNKIYKTAIAFELLHDFLLIHDDIIDRSDIRRGSPSIHKVLSSKTKGLLSTNVNGNDFAIIAGDIMFSLALKAFLSSTANLKNSNKAMSKFIDCSFFTELGEYIEMIESTKDITKVKESVIYKIYELKTARYTFSYPLSIGAELASANKKVISSLFEYGLLIGVAFQIKDDILGLFADEKKSGKSSLSDINEGKKTLLISKAYQNSNSKGRKLINSALKKKKITHKDLKAIGQIVKKSGSLDYAKKAIEERFLQSQKLLSNIKMRKAIKKELNLLAKNILGF
jgi:geranylgeranyl diphosphate synthase type I